MEWPKSSRALLVHLLLLLSCLNGQAVPPCSDDLSSFSWTSTPSYRCILQPTVRPIQSSIDFNYAVLLCNASSLGVSVNLSYQPVLLNRVTFSNCNAGANGGAIRATCAAAPEQCTLAVTNSVFRDCSTSGLGGAIFCPANLQLTSCSFDRCHSAQDGGAVYVSQGNASLMDCVFNGNRADTNGGALAGYVLAGLLVQTTRFLNNSATYYTAIAVTATPGDVQISNCQFVSNSVLTVATATAGAVYLGSYTLQSVSPARISNSLFLDNYANSGAAINSVRPTIVNGCHFENNTGTHGGGAIYSGADLTVTGCSFVNNVAGASGGAVMIVERNSWTEFADSRFVACSAGSGGSIHAFKGGDRPLVVRHCLFLNTVATGFAAAAGGAINLQGGGLVLSDSEFRNCSTAPGNRFSSGGALSMLSGNITNCLFIDCSTQPGSSANSGGGAISAAFYYPGDGLSVNCSVFRGCASTFGGTAIDIYSSVNGSLQVTDCSVESSVDLPPPGSTVGPNATVFAFRPAAATVLEFTLTRFYLESTPDCYQRLGQGSLNGWIGFVSQPTCNVSIDLNVVSNVAFTLLFPSSSPTQGSSAYYSTAGSSPNSLAIENASLSEAFSTNGTESANTTDNVTATSQSLATLTTDTSVANSLSDGVSLTQFTLVGNVQITWSGTTLNLMQVRLGDELTLYQFVSSTGQFDELAIDTQSGCQVDGTLDYYETALVLTVTQLECTTSPAACLEVAT